MLVRISGAEEVREWRCREHVEPRLTVLGSVTPMIRTGFAARARYDRSLWETAFVAKVVRQQSGRSPRTEFVTNAAVARLDELMNQTGHARVPRQTLQTQRAPCQYHGEARALILVSRRLP